MLFVVLPILLFSMLFAGASAAFSAQSGITGLAVEFMGFKAEEMQKYAESQWALLVQNDLHTRSEFVETTRRSVINYASGIVRSATEMALAVGADGNLAFATQPLDWADLSPAEQAALQDLWEQEHRGWVELSIAGVPRVGYSFAFEPFGWQLLITEQTATFYQTVNAIVVRMVVITAAVLLLASALLVFFTRYLTAPLERVVGAMNTITAHNDLSSRVEVEFNDEIGRLAHTFNIMMGQLESAYAQAKEYALNAVLAKKSEQKIRNIFQKYVPKDIIDSIFANPESMLRGDNRTLAIIFTDIRGFTTISESFRPDELVTALNRYFTMLVDIIVERGGIVDKYIGDAVMAFFGAPVSRGNDAAAALDAALAMNEAIERFNSEQTAGGRPPFITGIGINYGEVTVGNIGSEKKMDYTVIGDMVNLASRLEGLTKYYKEPLVISDSVYARVKDRFPCRLIDTVMVKGKTSGERVYTARAALTVTERRAWDVHARAMDAFYARDFKGAVALFRSTLELLPKDYTAQRLLERARAYQETPPPADWNGTEVMTMK